MTNQVPNTQLSSKVNSDTLDLMYNNFTKIVDWVIRGKASQFPMPGALAQAIEVLDAALHRAAAANDIAAQAIARAEAAEKHADTLRADVAALLARVEVLESATPAEKPKRTRKPKEEKPAEEVAAPAASPITPSAPETPVMADLGAPAPQQQAAVQSAGTVQAQVPPQLQTHADEEAISLTAAAIGAGDVNPKSLAQLETEIAAAMGG
jgi:hypothetical protein